MFKEILTNPLIGGLGTLIGALGLISSFIIYKLSKYQRKPWWAIRSTNLVRGYDSAIQKLTVSYDGTRVSNLSVSKIIFCNSGKQEIDKSDIETVNPLRISPKSINIKILDVQKLAVNSEASKVEAVLDTTKNQALIVFDYLNQGKGLVVQIIHTGLSSKDIEVIGDIKGTDNLIKRTTINKNIFYFPIPTRLEKLIGKRKTIKKILNSFTIIFMLMLGSVTLIAINQKRDPFFWINAIFFFVASLAGLWIIIGTWKRQIPKGLEAFEDEIVNLD